MNYSADYIIQRRKEKWEEDHNIIRDKELRDAAAAEIINNSELRYEILKYPEKLIEMFFVIVNKEQKMVPFFLNEVQIDFINKLNNAKEEYANGLITDMSFLVLKGRQQGFTSLITAYQLATILLNKNFEGYTIADSSSNTESIFEKKAKYPYSVLPDMLKPTEKYNNRRELRFDKLNSSWSIDTATKNMGRSRTVNFLHASECAFWQYGIAPTQASLGEALTKDAIKIYESTANGFNDFNKMWSSGHHINCFYEWWNTKEYRVSFESEIVKEGFIKDIENNSEWIFVRCKWLKETVGLEYDQIYWYYKKYLNYIDKSLIKQEYPCSPQEAFIASGSCIFDTEKIVQRINAVRDPIRRGYFTYQYDGLHISNISWIDDENGYIKIYKEPSNDSFLIGGDTAGEGSDNFTGHVINAKTGEQVAVLKHKFDEDLYTKQIYCLGKYYNTAMLAIECNFSTYPNNELDRVEYPKIYQRKREDTFTHRPVMAYGFKTTSLTRPLILSNLVELSRDNIDLINDKETLEEMLTFIRNEKGRPEAQEGSHDDLVMGLAIGEYVRPDAIENITKYEDDVETSFFSSSTKGQVVL